MSKTSKTIIFSGILILIIAIIIGFCVYRSNERNIPENTIGNTAGNLNNNGLFCENDGLVYFSNPYDSGCLYSMKPDQSDVKKLSDLSAKYINAGGNYIFYLGENTDTTTGFSAIVSKPGVFRIDKSGKKNYTLTKEITGKMLLVGRNLYYQHYTTKTSTTFAVMDVTKRKSTELLDYMVNPVSYSDGMFFYNGIINDHYLHVYNVKTGEDNSIWQGDIWDPVYDGGYVYYMDVQNNYRLCRYSITQNTIEILTNERIDFFNLYGDIIFYQVSSTTDPRLMRMNKNGSNHEIVASGVYNNINITSTYTYFSEFGKEELFYCTPTKGAVNVHPFIVEN